MTHALIELGHSVVAVDQSAEMLRHVHGADTVLADIETLDLGRRFPCVLLGSHLVNDDDDAHRRRFLACCRRHVADDGVVLIERLEPDLDWPAYDGQRQERGGVSVTLREVQLDGRSLSAVAEYRIGDDVWRQPFRSRLLDDDELAGELDAAGLRLDRVLGERRTWVAAVPA